MGIPALCDMLATAGGVEAFREAVANPAEKWENPIGNIGAENILITNAPATPEAVGKRVSEYGEAKGLDGIAAFADLYSRNRGDMTDVRFNMSEDNVAKVYSHPKCLVGSDGLYTGGGEFSHPRAFATFPRYLGRFIRERKVLSLEEGIHRLTGQAAERYRIKGRGFIREGYDADVTVFDPETVADRATYSDPFLPNEGIRCVILNGKIRAENGTVSGEGNGKFLTW